MAAEISAAPPVRLTPKQREAQLISRVYGNIHLEHPLVTRELVEARLRTRQLTEATDETVGGCDHSPV
jgi:hypothetical protein